MKIRSLFNGAPQPVQGFVILTLAYHVAYAVYQSMLLGSAPPPSLQPESLVWLPRLAFSLFWVILVLKRVRLAWVLTIFAGLYFVFKSALLLFVTMVMAPDYAFLFLTSAAYGLYTLFALGSADSRRYRDFGPIVG